MVRHLVEQNMFRVTDVADINLDNLGQVLERDSVAFVRGLIDPEEVRRFKASFEKQFDQGADRPGTGETPEEIMGHLQKLSIGGAAQSGVYRPRFFRTIYTPLWGRDRYGFHRIIRQTCKLRNHMYGRPLDFAIDEVEDGLWTAARVHHYPSGGGFLVGHRDTVVPRVHEEVGLGHFYQIIIVLSKAGEDFDEGGGFVELDGERLYFEQECELGDIAIYDSRTIHGVEDVDPKKVYDPTSPAGRIAGFVTLYRDIRNAKKLYPGYLLNEHNEDLAQGIEFDRASGES